MSRDWKELNWKRILDNLIVCYQKTQKNIARYDQCEKNEAVFDVSEIAGYATGILLEGLEYIGLVQSYWIHVGEGSAIFSESMVQWMYDNQDIEIQYRDYSIFE